MPRQKNDTSQQTFKLEIDADKNNLPKVLAFFEEAMANTSCPLKTQTQINLISEEIFINIAQYAYAPDKMGKVKISLLASKKNPQVIKITFKDKGIPYNPLKKIDPDITLSAEERQIGGLGIFMTKKMVDDIEYEYRDGCNILCLKKIIR